MLRSKTPVCNVSKTNTSFNLFKSVDMISSFLFLVLFCLLLKENVSLLAKLVIFLYSASLNDDHVNILQLKHHERSFFGCRYV